MIAKGNPHNDGLFLARYLAADSKGNESAELAELRGFATQNIFNAFSLGQLMKEGTKAETAFFHVQVRLPDDESLTREQWLAVADRIEKKLGFKGQPRAVVFHTKEGKEHMHLAFLRIREDGRAIDPGLYKFKLKEVCRALEKEYGLQQVRNERPANQKTKAPKRREYEESRRIKTDVKEIREGIRDLLEQNGKGADFIDALKAEGLVLSRGDRRDFVVIDRGGGHHCLNKGLTGLTAPQMRDYMADIDRATLPSVAEAKAMQKAKGVEAVEGFRIDPEEELDIYKDMTPEEVRHMKEGRAEEARKAEIGKIEEARRDAIQKDDEQRREAIQREEAEKKEYWAEELKKEAAARLAAEFGDSPGPARQEARAQLGALIDQAAEMERPETGRAERLKDYRAELERTAESGRAQARIPALNDAGYRYGQALAQEYNVVRPYESLARASMAEYGQFLRQQRDLQRSFDNEKNPIKQAKLQLQMQIEAAEYMGLTSDRIANQSYIISGHKEGEFKTQKERAAAFWDKAKDLRTRYNAIERMDKARSEPEPPQMARALPMVEERTDGRATAPPKSLEVFAKEMSLPNKIEPPPKGVDFRKDPAARQQHYTALTATARRQSAIENMAEDWSQGRNLNANDLRRLDRSDVETLKKDKGAALQQLLAQQVERDRQRERETGQGR